MHELDGALGMFKSCPEAQLHKKSEKVMVLRMPPSICLFKELTLQILMYTTTTTRFVQARFTCLILRHFHCRKPLSCYFLR